MKAIYNESDPFAARWLRNLIVAGHIADGVVDERSVADLDTADVAGMGQRHFFAGIAGWSLALRLAGVPDDASVWTGSCPCQPFSAAGRGGGFDDERHLWPAWFRLISECRPAVVFGEQVASPAGLGWLDAVFADMEGAGYACAAADLCAASVGAPHIRQRLFFVAYADGQRLARPRLHERPRRSGEVKADTGGMRASELADADSGGRDSWTRDVPPRREQPDAARGSTAGRVADAGRTGLEVVGEQQARRQRSTTQRSSQTRGVGDSDESRLSRSQDARASRRDASGGDSAQGRRPAGFLESERAGAARDWFDCDWIQCSDGVARPVEPGTHPLAHGVPGRVGLLRGYGNAIVPQVAATFIRAALEAP